jgi:hypothetical protein
VRRLLNAGRAPEAVEHLQFLDRRNVAEGTFYLGILARDRGSLPEALRYMERALALNPRHEATLQVLDELRQRVQPQMTTDAHG